MLAWLMKLRTLRWGLLPPKPPPQQAVQVYHFWLYLHPIRLQRPLPDRPLPLVVRTTLEICLQCQGTRALHLLEVGFLRLRDRKTLVLAYPGPLGPGQTLTLRHGGLELASSLGYGEALAPYVCTDQGLLYYEQPFVFEPELASVPVPAKPRPQTLQNRAQPLGEPTVRGRFRT